MIDKIKYVLDERNFERFVDTLFGFGYYFIPSSREDYRDTLTKANISLEADRYIPRRAFYSATVSAIVMILVALFIPVITLFVQIGFDGVLSSVGGLGIYEEFINQPVIQSILNFVYDITAGLSVPSFLYVIGGLIASPFYAVYSFLSAYAFELISLVIYVVVFFIIFTIGMLVSWYEPIYKTNERRRDINNNLPYSLTYMYSIVSGGRDVVGMLEILSVQEDVYGEVANEAKMIINRTRLGADIKTAVREQAEVTPSDELQGLLLDLVDLLEHTTDVESFFEGKTDESLYAAQQSLEQKYALLEYLNVFITLINFIPGMIVVLGITASIISGTTMTGVFILIPALVLISNAIIFGILYLIFGGQSVSIPLLDIDEPYNIDFDSISESSIPDYIKSIAKDIENDETFVDKIIKNPWYGFLITAPLYAPYIVVSISQFNLSLMQDTPIAFSFAYIMIPLYLIFSAYMILYELKYRRKKKVRDQLVNLFQNVRDKNKKGISLEEAIRSETENGRTKLEVIMNRYINKTALTPITTKYALEKASNKLNVTNLKRSVRLLTDTIEQTGEVSVILEIVVDDLKARDRIEMKRIQQANQTLVSIMMSAVILLVVFIIIDVFLITQFLEVQEQIESLDNARGKAADLANLDFGLVKASIIYVVVLVFLMSGLQTGYLRTGNLSSGLKYALIAPVLALGVLILL